MASAGRMHAKSAPSNVGVSKAGAPKAGSYDRAAAPPGLSGAPPRKMDIKRHSIRQACAAQLARRGLARMSMQALGEAAEIPHATLMYHYGDRETLLQAILSEHLDHLEDAVEQAMQAAREATPIESVRTMICAFLDAAAAEPDAHSVLIHGLHGLVPRDRTNAQRRLRLLAGMIAEPARPEFADAESLADALALVLLTGAGTTMAAPVPCQDSTLDLAGRMTAMLLAAAWSDRQGAPRPGCGGPGAACARAFLLSGMGGELAP